MEQKPTSLLEISTDALKFPSDLTVSPPLTLNLAAVVAQTRVLGPGLRAGVWVQGCCFACPGCIAPEWIPQVENQRVEPAALAAYLLAQPIQGLTLSGGEPFLQAAGLAALVRAVRRERAINVIAFSGFSYAALRRQAAAAPLLAETDLLIDGGYQAARNTGVGLRGSDNQGFHFLTPRLASEGYDFAHAPRRLELHFQGSELLVVGIPPAGSLAALEAALVDVQEGR